MVGRDLDVEAMTDVLMRCRPRMLTLATERTVRRVVQKDLLHLV